MGALEAPQNKHGQEHRTGTSRAEQTTEAMAELGALEAMAVQGAQVAMAELGALEAMADGLGPLGPAPTAGTPFTPPQKKFPGELRGYQEPSGARHRQTVHGYPSRAKHTGTGQDRTALRG